MSTDDAAETAVRNYLTFLEDPSKLVDPDEVGRLEASLERAADPVEKLRVATRLHRLHQNDREVYRQAFCAHAKEWSEANDIDVESFRTLGVDDKTLRSAGFKLRPQPSFAKAAARPKTRIVRVEDVKVAAAKRTSEFTMADVSEASGASPMTIRKALNEMIDSGEIERLGPMPGWAQPGRAPILFRPTNRTRR